MRKKLVVVFISSLLIAAVFSVSALAASKSWTLSGSDFRPNTGTITSTHYSNYATTYVSFKYSSGDVTAITSYNAEDKYAGIDIKNVPSQTLGSDMMDAYSIITSLPNAKTDLENDDIFGNRNEEAEAIALDPVDSSTTYYVSVNWTDYRTGAESDAGQWNVNAELSQQGINDYNTVDWSGCTFLTYGKTKGGGLTASFSAPLKKFIPRTILHSTLGSL
jgi:hypothetical protein